MYMSVIKLRYEILFYTWYRTFFREGVKRMSGGTVQKAFGKSYLHRSFFKEEDRTKSTAILMPHSSIRGSRHLTFILNWFLGRDPCCDPLTVRTTCIFYVFCMVWLDFALLFSFSITIFSVGMYIKCSSHSHFSWLAGSV